MAQNLEMPALAETCDNGKAIHADLALAIDHVRYFADVIRAQSGRVDEINDTTVAYHYLEPLGGVAQISSTPHPLQRSGLDTYWPRARSGEKVRRPPLARAPGIPWPSPLATTALPR